MLVGVPPLMCPSGLQWWQQRQQAVPPPAPHLARGMAAARRAGVKGPTRAQVLPCAKQLGPQQQHPAPPAVPTRRAVCLHQRLQQQAQH